MTGRALLFDFGGTLDADGIPQLDRTYSLFQERGLAIPRETFDPAFYDADDHLAARFPLQGLDLYETTFHLTKSLLKNLNIERAGLAEELAQTFTERCRAVFARNRPILDRLKADFSLGIVSNYNGNLSDILKREGLGRYFDVVADSGMLGYGKPDPRIFNYALASVKVEPQNAFMIGDSRPRDMAGAEQAGIPHILISSSAQNPCCPAGRSIRNVTELEACLAAEAPK